MKELGGTGRINEIRFEHHGQQFQQRLPLAQLGVTPRQQIEHLRVLASLFLQRLEGWPGLFELPVRDQDACAREFHQELLPAVPGVGLLEVVLGPVSGILAVRRLGRRQ